MQNPLTYLGSLLEKPSSNLASVPPGLGEQLILTWLKRDLAEMMADAYHEDLLRLRDGDAQALDIIRNN